MRLGTAHVILVNAVVLAGGACASFEEAEEESSRRAVEIQQPDPEPVPPPPVVVDAGPIPPDASPPSNVPPPGPPTALELFAERLGYAHLVVLAVCQTVTARVDPLQGTLVSDVSFTVDRVLKGAPTVAIDSVQVTIPGGTIGNRVTVSSHMPTYEANGVYVLFLDQADSGVKLRRDYGNAARVQLAEVVYQGRSIPIDSVRSLLPSL